MKEKNEQLEKELQEHYQDIGRLLGESLGDGVAEGSLSAVSAMETLGDELFESQKAYLQEKERIEQEMELAQEDKYRREYLNRLSKARTYQQAEIVRQNELFRLQKKANDAYLAELEEHLKQVEAQIKAQKEKIANEFNEIGKRALGSLSEVEKAREEMAEKMRDYGGLFDTKNVVFRNAGPHETPIYYKDTILDLSDERKELETYAELLKQVQMLEEIPEGLFSEIRNLSISDAIRYQEELLEMSAGERSDYIEDWKAVQKLSQETSNWAYTEDTRQALESIESELAAWYGTIPEGFFEEGKLSAKYFGTGFLTKLDSLQAELESAVLSIFPTEPAEWKSNLGKGSQTEEKKELKSITYILNSAGETVAEQLRSARKHADITRLRGES